MNESYPGEKTFNEAVARHTVELERRRFAKTVMLDRVRKIEGFDDVEMRARYDLVMEVMCQRREYTFELPEWFIPADWWQAFKERWFPKWALKRWPVRNDKLGGGFADIPVTAMFPELIPMQNKMRLEYYVDAPRFSRQWKQR